MRKRIDLNLDWEFSLCRGNSSVDVEKAENLKYAPVTLPHDWMIGCPFNENMAAGATQGYRDRWGTGFYKRKLILEKEQNRKYHLCFDGIYEKSSIYVNGQLVGGRKLGFSCFFIDVTEALISGENDVLVKVDNTGRPIDRWYTGCGIYRKVYLEILPVEHFDENEIQVLTEIENGLAKLSVNTNRRAQLRATLCFEGETVAEANGEDGTVVLNANSPKLWTAETPDLYSLTLQLLNNETAVDEISFNTGLRTIEISADKGLFINGISTKLKGVCVHQDISCFGTAVQKELWKERLLKLKEIGCNALRLAHHLYMPEMLDLCDELGFYVYAESLDKWRGGSYRRYYETEWESDLSCMVKRDRNRPSIIFWGVGNEVEYQAYNSMLSLLEKHVKKIKEMDKTRPVSVAMTPHFTYPAPEIDLSTVDDIQKFVDEDIKSGEIFDMDDRIERIKLIAQKVDFLACNYQEQWYERIHKAIPDKAILGTETYQFFRGYEANMMNYSDNNPWFDAEKKITVWEHFCGRESTISEKADISPTKAGREHSFQ